MSRIIICAFMLLCGITGTAPAQETPTGNVIFIHPDGTGMNTWHAYRFIEAGPDGMIAWDEIPHIGVYRGHMADSLTATSHGGATVHAYGIKVVADSYGMNGKTPLKALSGFDGSIMEEAKARGKSVGILNTGHVGEPGTGAFLASVEQRKDIEDIAVQIVASGAEVIMCGGEQWFLPGGTQGRHGEGRRTDGVNLVERAKEAGYTVVYTREELEQLELGKVDKLLGIFAYKHTFNDLSEEDLMKADLPLYEPDAPDLAAMMRAALTILSRNESGFLLVAEEEGPDNFGNVNNAGGVIESLRRSDAAYRVALDYVAKHSDTLLVTAADSDAGGLQVYSPPGIYSNALKDGEPLPATTDNGAPLDGTWGQGALPFESAPDKNGRRYPVGITFAAYADVHGAILARAAGLNSERLPLNTDNTDIYRLMYLTLFGKDLGLVR